MSNIHGTFKHASEVNEAEEDDIMDTTAGDPYSIVRQTVQEKRAVILEMIPDFQQRRAARVLVAGGELRARVDRDGLTTLTINRNAMPNPSS